MQDKLGQMPGQLWRGAGRTGRVAGDTGCRLGPQAGVDEHMLSDRGSFGRGKTRLQSLEGLSSDLGPPTLEAQGLINRQSADKSG